MSVNLHLKLHVDHLFPKPIEKAVTGLCTWNSLGEEKKSLPTDGAVYFEHRLLLQSS